MRFLDCILFVLIVCTPRYIHADCGIEFFPADEVVIVDPVNGQSSANFGFTLLGGSPSNITVSWTKDGAPWDFSGNDTWVNSATVRRGTSYGCTVQVVGCGSVSHSWVVLKTRPHPADMDIKSATRFSVGNP